VLAVLPGASLLTAPSTASSLAPPPTPSKKGTNDVTALVDTNPGAEVSGRDLWYHSIPVELFDHPVKLLQQRDHCVVGEARAQAEFHFSSRHALWQVYSYAQPREV
jgi:hypothetical protein